MWRTIDHGSATFWRCKSKIGPNPRRCEAFKEDPEPRPTKRIGACGGESGSAIDTFRVFPKVLK